jgi:beta-phosphoglucomutase-like phosphatase (HAD superfamily)
VIATLFDFNGVLIDDEAVHFAAFRDVVLPLGIDLERATYDDRYLGFDDAGAFKAMLTDAGRPAPAEEIARLIEAKKPVYMARIATELRIFDGAKDIVLRRAALGPVGIVSGALRHEIEHALDAMGVRDRIGFIVSAEDTTECKPHPEGYLLGLRALRREGDERGVAVIEDSLAGVAAAKHAKLRCAAVAHSYPADRLAAAGADAVAPTIAELTDAMIDG